MSNRTHSLLLEILAAYVCAETGCSVTIIGIQPKTLEFGGPLSAEVEEAVREVVEGIAGMIGS